MLETKRVSFFLLAISTIGLTSCGSSPKTVAPTAKEGPAVLERKLAQFTPAVLTTDISHLPASEQKALAKLIEASRLLDEIFDRQAYEKNPQLRERLRKDGSVIGKARFAYFNVMRSPWDRQDHFEPFAISSARPPGGGMYPEDLTEKEFRNYLKDHGEQKEALTSLFSIVRRDNKGLRAVRYSEAYAEWLKPAAQKLNEAANLTKNKSLSRFLKLRAKAFLDDDYYESDKAWMDVDSQVEVTIGPYETYEDKLMGMKAAFESFVTVADSKASKELARYKALLPSMEKNLPIPRRMRTVRGSESPIRVADVVFTSGDARKSVQTIAFNLPNDERVRKEKGAKKVLLRNLIETKFERIMKPIAEKIMVPAQQKDLSAKAFFYEVLFHELSHSLGPAFTRVDGKKAEVRIALGASHTPLEEAKADVMGAYNILFLIDKGDFDKRFRDELLVSYFAGLFRSVRFGVSESHGKGAALQINRFLEEGAAVFDATTNTFAVNKEKLVESITDLVRDICILQHNGDKTAADALLTTYGVMSLPMKKALSQVESVPVDIRPQYPLAGE